MNTNTNREADHIDHFELPTRTHNVLLRSGINTLSGVSRLTREEVLGLRMFNAAELPALEAVLKENGMDFATSSSGGVASPTTSENVSDCPEFLNYTAFDLKLADEWIAKEENLALVKELCEKNDLSLIGLVMHLPKIVWYMREECGEEKELAEILNERMHDKVIDFAEFKGNP